MKDSLTQVTGKEEAVRPSTANDRQRCIWFSNPWNAINIGLSENPDMEERDILQADPQPDGSWVCKRVTLDTTGVNGFLISPGGKTPYKIQADAELGGFRELRSYPINEDDSSGPYVALNHFGNDHPEPQRGIDGACLDPKSDIVGTAGSWVNGTGPMIYVWTPQGHVLSTHPLPVGVDMPTNCCFGGANQRTSRYGPGKPPTPGPQHRAQGWPTVR